MSEVLVLAEFDGAYGRDGEIWIELDACHVCGKTVPVLSSDGSNDEYACGRICFDCINEAFTKFTEGERGEYPVVSAARAQRTAEAKAKHDDYERQKQEHIDACDDPECQHWSHPIDPDEFVVSRSLETPEAKAALAQAMSEPIRVFRRKPLPKT